MKEQAKIEDERGRMSEGWDEKEYQRAKRRLDRMKEIEKRKKKNGGKKHYRFSSHDFDEDYKWDKNE